MRLLTKWTNSITVNYPKFVDAYSYQISAKPHMNCLVNSVSSLVACGAWLVSYCVPHNLQSRNKPCVATGTQSTPELLFFYLCILL